MQDLKKSMKVFKEYGCNISKYSIIDYIKTVGKTKYSADFIKVLSNGYYIVGSQEILYIYDNNILLNLIMFIYKNNFCIIFIYKNNYYSCFFSYKD